MLNQKDTDFDDLFRRASDKFPLRTDSADWVRMAAALDNPPPDMPEEGQGDRRRRRRFLWFFLLFPIGGAGYYIWHAGNGAGKAPTVVVAPVGVQKDGGDVKTGGAENGLGSGSVTAGAVADNGGSEGSGKANGGGATAANGGGTAEANGGNGATDAGALGNGGAAGGAVAGNGGLVGSGSAAAGGGSEGSGKANGGGTTAANGGGRSTGRGLTAAGGGATDAGVVGNGGVATSGGVAASGGAATSGGAKAGNRSVNGVGRKVSGAGGVMGSDMDAAVVSGKKNKNKKSGNKNNDDQFGAAGVSFPDGVDNGVVKNGVVGAGADSRVAGYPVNRAGISKDFHLTVNVEAPVILKDSSKTKPKTSSKQKSSYLYAGLMAAPDLSTVHFQQVKGVGTTYSFLLGYQFNKKWAVETGVSLDRKRYYTDAEYFNTSKLPQGALGNAKLTNLDGTCNMWEIPINVRYNFSQNEKSKWFATAGFSTYLMTKEKYSYNYEYGGWSPGTPKTWNWPVHDNYLFSIINLSAGYEHRLGGIGNLRVEPYLRVPLSGIGTGSLNILSAGLNIGITRRLW